MFVTFTYLFLFVVDADLRSVCGDFSLDLVCIARYGTRFSRMFWKITVWTQSATDDPDFVSPSTGHWIPPPMKRYIRQCTANMQKVLEFTYVDVRVYGESLLTFGERGIQKTLIPFVLTQSGWMLYYNNK